MKSIEFRNFLETPFKAKKPTTNLQRWKVEIPLYEKVM
jgi:hypothetical protein